MCSFKCKNKNSNSFSLENNYRWYLFHFLLKTTPQFLISDSLNFKHETMFRKFYERLNNYLPTRQNMARNCVSNPDFLLHLQFYLLSQITSRYTNETGVNYVWCQLSGFSDLHVKEKTQVRSSVPGHFLPCWQIIIQSFTEFSENDAVS